MWPVAGFIITQVIIEFVHRLGPKHELRLSTLHVHRTAC